MSITFAQWLKDHLGEDEFTDPKRTDPGADPGDYGIPNALRYAFGLDPRKPARDGLPEAAIAVPEGEGEAYLMITYQRRADAADLEYRVQASEDLVTWETLGEGLIVDVVPQDDGSTEKVTVRDEVPMAQASRRYLRTEVTLLDEADE